MAFAPLVQIPLTQAGPLAYSASMEPWHIALLIKPFALLMLFAILYFCVRRPVERYLPEGRLKRLLLYRWD